MKAEERWQARFRAPRVTLPVWARRAPARAVYRSNASGAWEIYAWDRTTGSTRQATARPKGTAHGAIDPGGQSIWWFSDTDGDEWGHWMRQPFTGGPDEPVDLGPGCPAGIALSATGEAAIGLARPGEGFTIHLVRPGRPTQTIYEHAEAASVAAMSLDGSLIAISHSEHGDSRHPSLRVVRQNGDTVGDLHDGPGRGVLGLHFAPILGDRRLLTLHERRDRREPLVWDPESDDQREIWIRDPGEITADWYNDGRSLLVVRGNRGRTHLHRYDLPGGRLFPIETQHGVIDAAVPRPDGSVEYSWSSGAHPPAIRSSNGTMVLNHGGPTSPPSVPVEDVDVEGPGGRIHALVSRPERGPGPFPTVFLLHGGPSSQDNDSFIPQVAAWVDLGFAVVRVNYRGSTGYGSAWRDALTGEVGHIELSDVAAVREAMVGRGIADPDRLVLSGASWGGYLTLLGLGSQPKVWAAGIATAPIADHLAAYEEETEALRAYHRALLGGSPAEQPERYASCSPITYVDQVEAPLLILAGENDPRCPIGQIDAYVSRLAERGHEHTVHRYDAGHGSLVVSERVAQMAAQLEFACKYVRTEI
ncbi:dipeptidyl aminopeptidase/acylaminoacyl peptidase [Streptosporangium album]|uniref:Dipeptidyl aminopeptidase/acylaminoacyl peptidase n=1 Tax=Streptosporangium album TaxID=47479 RepID=A0A7W7W9E4_9ACTN|nr:prolyl oligopeptidase family serine peptidase [Streptosporangium album]MBB4938806.1 dipeptidyl aminopeptidase/acylaminoacyl peptidase [Streptosporangium album]